MGSGKSSVARVLAYHLQTRAIDLDTAIEANEGRSIAEIFRESGEAYFRESETRALQSTLNTACIVATGGGVVTREANRILLQSCREQVVYLRAQPETLARRIRLQPGTRPLIDGQSLLDEEQTIARVREILNERAPLYQSCAGITVDSDGRSLDDVGREIVTRLPHQTS